ncbi:hypothetical protein TcasGA2_TC004867 [Tribolium castaneum]|uniref:Uncharacterized protein n=1 Tax=Tribolium castaneum TaxID=7070 RepID=D6WBM1_TRICA|nr:hypothetical protein TcasGA2_TC004867 [Tribolium castaneum]
MNTEANAHHRAYRLNQSHDHSKVKGFVLWAEQEEFENCVRKQHRSLETPPQETYRRKRRSASAAAAGSHAGAGGGAVVVAGIRCRSRIESHALNTKYYFTKAGRALRHNTAGIPWHYCSCCVATKGAVVSGAGSLPCDKKNRKSFAKWCPKVALNRNSSIMKENKKGRSKGFRSPERFGSRRWKTHDTDVSFACEEAVRYYNLQLFLISSLNKTSKDKAASSKDVKF